MASSRPADPFDAAFPLNPLAPSGNVSRFECVAPAEMAGGGVGFAFMYGGYLNALVLKAAMSVTRPMGFPHPLQLNIDFISGVKKGERMEIAIEITKSTRRLCFVRATLRSGSPSSADPPLVLTASGLFGTLSSGDPARDAPTLLEGRYRLPDHLALVPSLRYPDAMRGDLLEEGVAAMPGRKVALGGVPALKYMDFFRVGYSDEAVRAVGRRVREGGLRSESWEEVHRMPYIVAHPSGRKPDLLSAAFYCDLFPAAKHLSIGLGPTLPSVTISLTVHFCKPVDPGSRFLYMCSGVPYADRATREAAADGYVEGFESTVWGEKGELVCLHRQQRLVTGREVESRFEQLQKASL
ncbi:thioesterase-like superfamily-domain-containing protein [Hyaloraphidium curvatum]|nr:thioesterase-like superfamily-domain-containing protein [Hyaloraphidium curvatum]